MFCSSTRTQLTQHLWCCQSRPLRKCCRTPSLLQPLQTQPLTHPLTHLSRPPRVWPPASLKHIQQLSHQVTSLLYLSLSMKMFCLLNSQYNIIEMSHVYLCVHISLYLSLYLYLPDNFSTEKSAPQPPSLDTRSLQSSASLDNNFTVFEPIKSDSSDCELEFNLSVCVHVVW